MSGVAKVGLSEVWRMTACCAATAITRQNSVKRFDPRGHPLERFFWQLAGIIDQVFHSMVCGAEIRHAKADVNSSESTARARVSFPFVS